MLGGRSARLAGRFAGLSGGVQLPGLQEEGSLVRMIGIKLEAVGCQAPIGSRCLIITEGGGSIEAEVVGFSDVSLILMPEGNLRGVQLGARVVPLHTGGVVAVDEQLLGRVIDGAGNPIDGHGPIRCLHSTPLRGESINPLNRSPITDTLDVGVRAINALLTMGKGQRLGLFAGSGVGKSTLLGMMTRFTEADVIVVSLVGERGREVREFVDDILGAQGPSVFSLLPALVERAGNGVHGSITAVYTVLVEGGDFDDPVSDASRAILDGHIVLSREVADSGLFPAIDVDASVSRLMTSIVDAGQLAQAREIKSLYAAYQQNRDLINIGAYQNGSDEQIDRAIAAAPRIRTFIAQHHHEKVDMQSSREALLALSNTQLTALTGGDA